MTYNDFKDILSKGKQNALTCISLQSALSYFSGYADSCLEIAEKCFGADSIEYLELHKVVRVKLIAVRFEYTESNKS